MTTAPTRQPSSPTTGRSDDLPGQTARCANQSRPHTTSSKEPSTPLRIGKQPVAPSGRVGNAGRLGASVRAEVSANVSTDGAAGSVSGTRFRCVAGVAGSATATRYHAPVASNRRQGAHTAGSRSARQGGGDLFLGLDNRCSPMVPLFPEIPAMFPGPLVPRLLVRHDQPAGTVAAVRPPRREWVADARPRRGNA